MSMEPITHNVGTTSEKVVAQRGMRLSSFSDWVTGTAYGQGAIVASNGFLYMAVAAGTSGATAPIGVGDVSDGTVTWRYVPRSKRGGITIQNQGAVDVSLAFGYAAVDQAGVVLEAGGSFSVMSAEHPDVQHDLNAIAASGTADLSILEW